MTVAESLGNIAVLFFGQKQWKEAEAYLLKSTKIYEDIFLGEANTYLGAAYLNLAIVYRNLREFEKAEPLYRKALEQRERTVGTQHHDYAQALNGLAVFYMNSRNRPEQALPMFLETMGIYQRVYGNDNNEVAYAHENIAICILNMYDKGNAESHPEANINKCADHQKEALRIFKVNTSVRQSFPNIYQRISEFYRMEGQFEKALEWSETLLETFNDTNLVEESDLQDNKRNRALVLAFQGKMVEANAILREEKYQPGFYSAFYQSVSNSYKTDEQLTVGMEALQLGLQHYPGDIIFLYNLGHCNALLKNWQGAKQYFQKMVDLENKDVDALIGLGEAKIRLGEKDVSDLDKALKLINAGGTSDPRVERIQTLKKEK